MQSFRVAIEDLMNENNHHIGKNSPYILVTYYEKKATLRPVYVYQSQVMSPGVNVSFIGSNVNLGRDEYQWLCDSI